MSLFLTNGGASLVLASGGIPVAPGGVTGVAQGDNSYALLFIDDGPQIVVTAVSAPDNSGTFRILGVGSVQVLVTGLTASSSRAVTGLGATITNNADSDSSSPYDVTAGGTLDLTVVTTSADTTITVS